MKKTQKILFIAIALQFTFSICLFGQFKPSTNRSLFSDVKAQAVGDAITILIVEDMQANNSATSSSGRNTDLSAGFNADFNNKGASGNIGLKSSNDFKGSGETSRRETIKAKLSAIIDSVDQQSGLLRIKGSRTTVINGETQTIQITGSIRPVDILPNNSVYSYNIIDLNLRIEGKGFVTETQEPGLITKFLRILF